MIIVFGKKSMEKLKYYLSEVVYLGFTVSQIMRFPIYRVIINCYYGK